MTGIFHGTVGGVTGLITMQVMNPEPSPTGTVIKAIATLIIGLLGTLLSKWIDRQFPPKAK